MAAEQEEIVARISADTASLNSGLSSAVRTVQDSIGQMRSSMSSIATVSTTVARAFAGFTAALGGALVIKNAVADTNAYVSANEKLGRQLGMTAGEASVLAQALDDVLVDTDEYAGAALHLTRQLRSNEDGLRAMGVQTRDANGQLKGSKDLMDSALSALQQFKDGTDRNAAAQVLFGRGASDASKLLRTLTMDMDAARAKAEELGLTVTQQNVEAMHDFERASRDSEDVLLAFKKSIADAVTPAFTGLMVHLSDAATKVLPVFRVAVNAITSAWYGVQTAIFGVWAVAKAIIENLTVGFVGLGTAVKRAVTGDFEGAARALRVADEQIADNWRRAFRSISDEAQTNWDKVQRIWGQGTPAAQGPAAGGTKSFVDPEAVKRAGAAWLKDMKATLDQLRTDQGYYRELSKAEEFAYWDSLIAEARRYGKEVTDEVFRLRFEAGKAAAKDQVEEERAALDLRLEQAKQHKDEQVAIAGEWAERMRTLYGEDSKEYAKALREKVKLEQEAADEVRKIQEIRIGANRELGSRMLDYERDALRFRRELGLISAEQEIEGERALEQRRYELMQESLRLREELAGADQVQQAQLRADRELLEQEHQGRLLELDRARIRASIEEQNRLVDTVASTFTSVANSLLQGTMTFRSALLRIVDTVVSMFVDMGVRMVADWIKRQILMTSTTQAQNNARMASDVTAATTGALVSSAASDKKIMSSAGAAAAGAAESQASIPYVGPALAIAAAAAIFGLVMGFRGKSAAGGWWQIPSDTMAMIHKDEMVLPSHLAEGVRSVVEGGAGAGGGAVYNVSISALDGASVYRVLTDNKRDLMRALREAHATNSTVKR